jgi:response regulator RpfG family c-di-GMP phosphodiesterase
VAPTPDDEGEVELLERWAATIDAARPGGEGRSKRVSWIAGRIAEAMQLPDGTAEHIRRVALLHDLGSRRISGAGTTGVHDRWRRDPEAGLRLLEGTAVPVLVGARRMLGALEEHWDGSGQPQGLRGDSIPVEARIVSVALRFDELSSDPATAAGATAEVETAAGSLFDPDVVTALLHTQVVGA